MSLIDIVQSPPIAKNNGGSSLPSNTFASTPASGHGLLAVIAINEQPGDATISLAGWTTIATENNTTKVRLYAGYKIAGASEPTVVTGSLTASRRWAMWLAELDDVVTASMIDVFDVSLGSTSAFLSAAIATNFADERWFAFFAGKNTVALSLPTNGFTLTAQGGTTGASANDVTLGVCDKNVSATGTAQAGLTADQDTAYASIIVAIKAVSASVPKSGSDSGSGSESATPKAVISSSQAGSGVDSSTAITNNKSGSDAAVGSDSLSLAANPIAADFGYVPIGGFGEDPFGVAPFGAAGEETVLVPKIVDVGAGVEGFSLIGKMVAADVGLNADVASLAITPLLTSDSGSLADSAIENTLLGLNDLGSDAESAVVSTAVEFSSDAAGGSDSTNVKASVAGSADSGSESDTAIVRPVVTGLDQASDTENTSSSVVIAASDSGSSIESGVSPQITFVGAFDLGTAFENFVLMSTSSAQDAASSVEGSFLTTPASFSDSGSGTEQGAAVYAYSIGDNSSGVEAAVVTVLFTAFETSSGVVEYAEARTVITAGEVGTESDISTLLSLLVDSDQGILLDDSGIGIRVSDSGAGVQVAGTALTLFGEDFGSAIDNSSFEHIIRIRYPGDPAGLVLIESR